MSLAAVIRVEAELLPSLATSEHESQRRAETTLSLLGLLIRLLASLDPPEVAPCTVSDMELAAFLEMY